MLQRGQGCVADASCLRGHEAYAINVAGAIENLALQSYDQ